MHYLHLMYTTGHKFQQMTRYLARMESKQHIEPPNPEKQNKTQQFQLTTPTYNKDIMILDSKHCAVSPYTKDKALTDLVILSDNLL